MKKISITFLFAGLLGISSINAQSVQDGINDLYAGRNQSAKATFDKLIAANPNNIDATYWLGQTFIEMENVAGAKAVYDKALLASANAPLLIVGMGQVELMENKINEARQRFEAAITMTSGKKGEDPVILNAVGRAITNTYTEKEKKGDINFAVQKLQAAAPLVKKDNNLLADIYVNLGNAIRKAQPGSAGGPAFENYQKAMEANPAFATAYLRTAQLFNTQRNWDLYEKYLNDAIAKDPKFAPAYYELYYYKLSRLDFTTAQEMASKYIANSDPDPQADHFKAQTYWAEKKYDDAIGISKSIIAKAGEATLPRTYILLADSYLSKKDSATGKEYIDKFFAKAKPTDISAVHFGIKAGIYSSIPGQEEQVLQSYVEGVKADTVLDNKIDLLKKGIAFFAARKQYDKEAILQDVMLSTKPNLTINDYFAAGISNYRGKSYEKSYSLFSNLADKFPDQIFGWEWKFNNAQIIDTVKKDSIAVPAALALLEFTKNDTVKYAKQIFSASYFLANYYVDKKDNAKTVEYLTLMKAASTDPAQKEKIQGNIDAFSKPGQRPPAKPSTPKSSKIFRATSERELV